MRGRDGSGSAAPHQLAACRLDWTGDTLAKVDPADAVKMAILARFKAAMGPAMGNLAQLGG